MRKIADQKYDVNFFPVVDRERELPVYAVGIGAGHEQEELTIGNWMGINVLHLHMTVSGCGIIYHEGKRYILPIGTMMYTPPNVMPHIAPAPGGWIDNWVTIFFGDLSPGSSILSLGDKLRIFRPENPNEINRMYETINRELTSGTLHGRLMAAAEAYRMICAVISCLEENSDESLTDSLVVSDAVNYIHAHVSENITLSDLCAVCRGISPQYLCRLFKRYMEMRPVEYIRKVRISRAKKLLSNTDLTVQEVAAKCGFESPTYFYRCWNKTEKESPAEYRRGHKGIFV
ncbi:MAG: AraC family transcriptional regulator [Clostridiales bacterium]|nr:AraC family transcriptional regulator [Clostridiales bacterium]